MKSFTVPCIYGVISYYSNKRLTCTINSSGKYKLSENKYKLKFKLFNVFFLRGILYLLYGFVFLINGLFLGENENSVSKTFKKAEKSLNISAKSIFYFCLTVLSLFFAILILGVLPLSIGTNILGDSTNILARRVVVCLFKIVILYLIFLTLKYIPSFNQYYKFNTAVAKESDERVNFLSFLIFSLFLSIIVLSLFGLSLYVWYFFIINALLAIFCFSLSYELFVLSNHFIWIKNIFTPFIWLVNKKPSQKELKCVRIIKSEMNLTLKGNTILENDKDMSFSEAYINAKEVLQKSGKFEKSDLDFIFAEVLNKNRAEIKLIKSISKEDYNKIIKICQRRAGGEPISKIFKSANFYGLDFIVTKDVLSPRMDTERLVEMVLKYCNSKTKILDIGTGSGVIAVTIAKKIGAKVTAIDISEQALEVAKKNAEKNGVKISFKKSDIFSSLKKEKFDIIVSNPPYIPSEDICSLDDEVKKYDPLCALDGGDDGLEFYRKIIGGAPNHLSKNGMIFFEVGVGQAEDVKNLLQKNFKDIKIIKDYNRIDRVVYGILKEKII